MFNSIIQKNLNLESKKSYDGFGGSLVFGLDNIFSQSTGQGSFIKYYLESSPVFTAINLISNNVASIEPVLRNKRTGEYIYEHEVLNLLNRPNPFTTRQLFFKQLSSYFKLTGNAYIAQSGSKKVVELSALRPQNITIQEDYKDGYPKEYSYSSGNITVNYDRKDYRFYAKNGNEINQLINFNPKYSSSNLYGISDLVACEIEISQYLLASIHNNSLLKNQARPSGLLTYKGNEILDQEGIDAVRDTIKATFSGAANAGKTAILSGDFDWKQMSESIKDMDFATLKNQTELAVYKCLQVPMSYATNDASTFNNKEIAKLDLYDNAVIPLRQQIDQFLTDSIMYRYDPNLEITFDPASVEALLPRRIANADKLSKMNAFSRDEIRNIMGYKNITGGDIVYQPQNLIAVGTDQDINNDRESARAKSIFIKSMKDGGYNDDVINDSIKKWFH